MDGYSRNSSHHPAFGRSVSARPQERKKMQSPTARDTAQGPLSLAHSAVPPPISAPRWRAPPAAAQASPTSHPHWFGPAVTAASNWVQQAPSWLASMLIHMTALLVVASISLHVAHSVKPSVVVATPTEPV